MIKINDYLIREERFPDGALRLKLSDCLYSLIQNSKSLLTISWLYDNDAELFTLMCLVDKIRTINTNIILHLNLPYIPSARMDRIHSNDVFTLKTFCNIINSINFQAVWVTDPHSDVSAALLNNVRIISTLADQTMIDVRKRVGIDNFVCMYPDAGASKKFSTFIQNKYVFGNKRRDWETGKIQGLDLITNEIDLKDKTVLIIDDICSYGGTFYYSAKALKEAGVKDIYLFVDHCENSVLEGDMIKSGLIKKIYTTDSIFTGEHKDIKIVYSYRKYKEI